MTTYFSGWGESGISRLWQRRQAVYLGLVPPWVGNTLFFSYDGCIARVLAVKCLLDYKFLAAVAAKEEGVGANPYHLTALECVRPPPARNVPVALYS